jgi:hypothetical protein
MDPEEAVAAAAPPPPAVAATVVLRDGRLADFDTAESAQAFMSANPDAVVGLDTPELQRAREFSAEYGASPYIAAGLGALRGATVGLSSGAAGLLGLGEEERAYREANPAAALGGEALGVAGSMLYGAGEVGLAARAARAGLAARTALGATRAVTAPARALLGVSEAAGAAVGRRLAGEGAGALARVGAGAAALATEGAIESAAYEAGGILSEQTLREPPALTAESILARIGTAGLEGGSLGALLGGGLAIGGAGARAATASVEQLSRSLRQRLGRDAAPGVAELAADAYTRAAAFARGADPDSVGQFTRLTPEAREARRIVQEGPDATFEVGSRQIQSSLDNVFRNLDGVLDEAIGARKLDDVERVIRTDTSPDQLRVANEAIERVRAMANDIRTDPNTFGVAGAAARRMEFASEAAQARITAALADEAMSDARRATEIFGATDVLKRQVGRARQAVRERGAREIVDNLYESIRSPLEDESVWGEGLRGIQTETNAAWNGFLTWDGDFSRRFTRDGEGDGFDRLRAANSGGVSSFLGQIGRAANESQEQIFRDWLTGTTRLTDSIGTNYAMSPANVAKLSTLRRDIASLRSAYETTARRAGILADWQAVSGSSGSGLAGVLGSAATTSAVLGGGVGAFGPLGAAAAGLSAISNPGRVATLLGSVERATARTNGDISGSIRRFLRSGSEAVGAAAGTTARAIPAATAAARSEDSRRRYLARSRRIERDLADPAGTSERLATSTRDLERVAPSVAAEVHAAAARGQQHLAETMPQGRRLQGQLFGARTQPQPSPEQMRAWMRRADVVDDPLTVLDSLRRGTISREEVETLRAVYPALHARIVEEATRQIMDAGAPLSYQDRIRIGILLGITSDPSLDPETLATLQATYQQTTEQPSPQRTQPAPRLASQLATGTERIEARR